MKYVYNFGDGKADGKADMKNLLGGKGANLAEMNVLGIPVPPGFTLTTDVCTEYYDYEFYNDLVKNCSTSYNPKNYESSYIILTKKEKFVKIFKNLIPTLW